ncbi:unnamed protein product, partial [Ceratitis capitata]
ISSSCSRNPANNTAILELVKRQLDNSTQQHMKTDDTETPLKAMQTDYTDQDYIEPTL